MSAFFRRPHRPIESLKRNEVIERLEKARAEGKRPPFSFCAFVEPINGPDALLNDLHHVNFEGAVLKKINFGTANVLAASFRDADLTDADLSLVKNLLPEQLSGANLTRCKLPDDIKKWEALATVAELSKNAGTLFSILLVGCVFVLLVAYTTKDIQLLLDSGTATLPVINLPVSPRLFLGIAPLVLFGQYVTMHLYLQRLWEVMATLPAIFPDGVPLDRKSYPWLLNDLVRAAFPRLKTQRAPLAPTQLLVFRFLSYHLTSLASLLVFVRCIMTQDFLLQGTQIGVTTLFVGSSDLFRHVADFTLRRDTVQRARYGNWLREWWHWRAVGAMAGTAAFLSFVGPAFIPLGISRFPQINKNNKVMPYDKRIALDTDAYPWTLWHGSLSEDATLRPDGFTIPTPLYVDPKVTDIKLREAQKEQVRAAKETLQSKIRRGNLSNKNLRYLDVTNAFLTYASFKKSNLSWANLYKATLVYTDFSHSILTNAKLERANLTAADLTEAIVTNVNLSETSLMGADLSRSNFTNSIFSKSNLTNADLYTTNLTNTDLKRANLSDANFLKATLVGADLSFVYGIGTAHLDSVVFNEKAYMTKEGVDILPTKWPQDIRKLRWTDVSEQTQTGTYRVESIPQGKENPEGYPLLKLIKRKDRAKIQKIVSKLKNVKVK